MCGGSPKAQTAPLPVMPAERSVMPAERSAERSDKKMPDSGTILTNARRKVTGKMPVGASTILTNQLSFANDTSTKKTLLGQ